MVVRWPRPDVEGQPVDAFDQAVTGGKVHPQIADGQEGVRARRGIGADFDCFGSHLRGPLVFTVLNGPQL